jgi:hypothetical protein
LTGPNGSTFDVALPDVVIPPISAEPCSTVGPAFKSSAFNGKFMLTASRSWLVVLALLNSSIVKAVFELGDVKTALPVVINGIDIADKALAGCTAATRINAKTIEYTINVLTYITLLTISNYKIDA